MDPGPYLNATCGLPTKIAEERENSLIETYTMYPPVHDQPLFCSLRFLAARLGSSPHLTTYCSVGPKGFIYTHRLSRQHEQRVVEPSVHQLQQSIRLFSLSLSLSLSRVMRGHDLMNLNILDLMCQSSVLSRAPQAHFISPVAAGLQKPLL